MSGLHRLQNQFQDYLLNSNPLFQNSIVNTKKIPAETRLAIYANAYRSRLIDALAANYPVLQAHLGCAQFEELGQAYLSAYPSLHRSIRWFGDQLTHFLCKNSCYKEIPYLGELAQFEWTLTLVFDATDSTILQMEKMDVNIKAGTNEECGEIGRGEAIAAQVVVLLELRPRSKHPFSIT